MSRSRSVVLAAALVVVSAGAAQGVVIDFDTFPGGASVPANTLITRRYAPFGVVFSSPASAGGPQAYSNGEASSGPNFLVGLDASGSAGLDPITMDFVSGYASSVNLTLISVGSGTVTANAYASDLSTILSSVTFTNGLGAGVGFGNHDPISLTMGSGSGIARITLSITQAPGSIDGFGIDDVEFNTVPAPSAAALLGLGGFMSTRRRRAARA